MGGGIGIKARGQRGHVGRARAIGADPLPVLIEETETNFTGGWQGRHEIDGDTFIYEDTKSRRLNAIRGWPVKQLLRAISEADRRSPSQSHWKISKIFGWCSLCATLRHSAPLR